MIRVLHVIGMMERGGAETYLMNLYRAIDRTKVQFDFLVHEEHECAYNAEIRALGGHLYALPRPSAASLFTSYARACRCFFDQHHTSSGDSLWPIVHGHMGSSALVYLHEARKAGCHAIAHSHCVNFYLGSAGLAFKMATFPDRYIAQSFMACSRDAGIDRFGKRIVESDRFSVARNGIFCSSYACDQITHERTKRALGLEGRPVFGHVGLLRPEKNHAFLLDTFAHIRRELPRAVLLLVGGGALEGELRHHARELGIADSVAFLGSSDIVPELLKAMDVFIFPSQREGLGMALIEAQAAGLPCLCSEGIPRDALIAQDVRVLPLSDGTHVWADAAVALYQETAQRPRTDHTTLIAQAGFDIETTAQWLEDFYLAICANSSHNEKR